MTHEPDDTTIAFYRSLALVELLTLRAAFVADGKAGGDPAFVRGRLAVIGQAISEHLEQCECRTPGCGHRAREHGPGGVCRICQRACWS